MTIIDISSNTKIYRQLKENVEGLTPLEGVFLTTSKLSNNHDIHWNFIRRINRIKRAIGN